MSTISVCEECGAVSLMVEGEPVSKSNSRQIVGFGSRSALIKSKKALALERHWKQDCPELTDLITDDVEVTFRLYYKSRRPDLDESLIMDLLQGKIIKNDRQIKVKHVYHGLDQNDPRSELFVQRLDSPCSCNNRPHT